MEEAKRHWKVYETDGQWGPKDTTLHFDVDDYERGERVTMSYAYPMQVEETYTGFAGAMEPVSFMDIAISLEATEDKLDRVFEEIEIISFKLDAVMDHVARIDTSVGQDELENKILAYVEEHGSFWPDELARELGVDPFLVIDICEKLVLEDKLKGEKLEGEVIEPE